MAEQMMTAPEQMPEQEVEQAPEQMPEQEDEMFEQTTNPEVEDDDDSELTPESFKQSMDQARKLFASKGIKSKADAYQLINQGYTEHRFNESDVSALQHAASLVFDSNGFTLAKTLLAAKDKGLKLAATKRQARGKK